MSNQRAADDFPSLDDSDDEYDDTPVTAPQPHQQQHQSAFQSRSRAQATAITPTPVPPAPTPAHPHAQPQTSNQQTSIQRSKVQSTPAPAPVSVPVAAPVSTAAPLNNNPTPRTVAAPAPSRPVEKPTGSPLLSSASSELFPSLITTSSSFSFDSLKYCYRNLFLSFLTKSPPGRLLLISHRLSPLCSTLLGMKFLSEYAQQIVIFPTQNIKLDKEINSISVILNDDFDSVNNLIKILNPLINSSDKPIAVHCGFIPRLSSSAFKILEQSGLIGSIEISNLPILVNPLDNTIGSMENNNSFRDYYLLSDPSPIYQMVELIKQIQQVYGPIHSISGKGAASNQFHRMFISQQQFYSNLPAEAVKQGAANKFAIEIQLIDRDLDLITPFLTQLTYEGTIEELLGIESGYVKLQQSIINNEKANASGTVSYRLNDGDYLYSRLRHASFGFVLSNLRSVINEVKSAVSESESVQSMNVKEMKNFISQRMPEILKAKANAQTHFNLCQALAAMNSNSSVILNTEAAILEQTSVEQIWSAIENLIQRQQPWQIPMRLLILTSIINDGIKLSILQTAKQEFLQAYGFQFLPMIINLERLGLLQPQAQTNAVFANQLFIKKSINYTLIRKYFNLIPMTNNTPIPQSLNSPTQDLSFAYSFSGYSPLSCKILEQLGKTGGWSSVDRMIKDAVQSIKSNPAQPAANSASTPLIPLTLVVFLGGVCSSEISCLRWLHYKKLFPANANSELVILTTQIFTGNSILEQIKI